MKARRRREASTDGTRDGMHHSTDGAAVWRVVWCGVMRRGVVGGGVRECRVVAFVVVQVSGGGRRRERGCEAHGRWGQGKGWMPRTE